MNWIIFPLIGVVSMVLAFLTLTMNSQNTEVTKDNPHNGDGLPISEQGQYPPLWMKLNHINNKTYAPWDGKRYYEHTSFNKMFR